MVEEAHRTSLVATAGRCGHLEHIISRGGGSFSLGGNICDTLGCGRYVDAI